jgi:hypothetical protein
MAIYDIIGEFSDGQDVTSITTTGILASTNTLDLAVSDLNFGSAEIWLNIQIHTAFTSSGSPTTRFDLKSSTDTTINASDTAVLTVTAQDLTSLSVGDYVFRGRIPLDTDIERYIAILMTQTGDEYATGNVDIWLEHSTQTDHPSQKAQSNIT